MREYQRFLKRAERDNRPQHIKVMISFSLALIVLFCSIIYAFRQ